MVNVKDFDNPLPEGDLLEIIFKRQSELISKYHPLEEKNVGHSLPYGNVGQPFDLNSPECQQRLKDFAWRITEEIAEATECAYTDKIHFMEELVDALHFFVELLIYIGFTPGYLTGICQLNDTSGPPPDFLVALFDRSPRVISYDESAWETVEGLGKAMNCLKNKPWKQTHIITDERKFHVIIADAFNKFIDLLIRAGFTPETLTKVYLNKNDVNHFRIGSAY